MTRKALVLLVATVLGLALPAVVTAEEPPQITDRITDSAGALEDIGAVEAALDRLEAEEDIQLFPVYVQTTQPLNMREFVDETVEQNNLAGRDSLLVVAVEDQTYELWLGSDVADSVSEGEHDDILRDLEDGLSSDDFDGATAGVADGLRSAAGSSGSGGGSILGWLIPIAVIALIGAGVWWFFSSRKKKQRAAKQRQAVAQTAAQANTLLIETDQALREAYQEVDFAAAQFGDEGVTSYRAALGGAGEKLQEAFRQHQALSSNATGEQAQAAVAGVVELAQSARSEIDAQVAALAGLRDVERNAPDVLAGLRGQLGAVEQRLPGATAAVEGLSRYTETTWRPVADNPRLAQGQLETVKSQLAEAEAAVSSGQPAAAVGPLRAAEAQLAATKTLLDTVDDLAAQVQDAETRLPQQMAAAEADLEAARQSAAARPDPAINARLMEAQAVLEGARKAAADRDPLQALQLAEQVNAVGDEILAQMQQRELESRQAYDLAVSSIQTAESACRRASDFVMSNRSTGVEARSGLREAETRLQNARNLLSQDPRRAAAEAQAATGLAEQAIAYTTQGPFGMPGMGGGGVPYGMPGGAGGGGLGSILGGLGGLAGMGAILMGGGGGGMGGGRRNGSGMPAGRSQSMSRSTGGRSRGGRW
jgi:hypothetical protein